MKQDFLKKYGISLNAQQKEALFTVEGANLLLAVPGSGKTTVLVARLGYMVLALGIPADRILVLTYNKSAAQEMQQRFVRTFGTEAARGLQCRTIHSFAYSVYEGFRKNHNRAQRHLVTEKEQKDLIRDILQKRWPEERFGEGELTQYLTHITYAKNMACTEAQRRAMDGDLKDFSQVFRQYEARLHEDPRHPGMDYDDQLVWCHWLLENRPSVLEQCRQQYPYILVDEAQDTSKIQHGILKLLAQNIFMVGDEDQSIYGFRAAFPQALLDFSKDYEHARVFRLEKNYRSTPAIVKAANGFIRKNTHRYPKKMTAQRKEGEAIRRVEVPDRKGQYAFLLCAAEHRTGEMAILYRENESAVVLMDWFLRKGIPFTLQKSELNFFQDKVVRTVWAYLKLTADAYDLESLRRVNFTGILHLPPEQLRHAVSQVEQGKTVLEAVAGERPYLDPRDREDVAHFRFLIEEMEGETTEKALGRLLASDFGTYLKRKKLDDSKIDLLRMMAAQEPSIPDFLKRLGYLSEEFQKDSIPTGENPVILSTVHSSKGLEYDTVYLADVYDGKFPSSRPDVQFHAGEDNDQEERRIFYVAMTRAKNRLVLMSLEDQKTSFLDEVCPIDEKFKATVDLRREIAEAERRRQAAQARQLEVMMERQWKAMEEWKSQNAASKPQKKAENLGIPKNKSKKT